MIRMTRISATMRRATSGWACDAGRRLPGQTGARALDSAMSALWVGMACCWITLTSHLAIGEA